MNFSGRQTSFRDIKKVKSSQKVRIVPTIQKKSKSKNQPFQGTIDYKNVALLRKFITAEGKILPRRLSGLKAKQQRYISKAIKNSRMTGLLPFVRQTQPF